MKLSIFQKNKKRGSSIWYLRKQSNGKVTIRTLKTSNKIEAEKKLAAENVAAIWESNNIPTITQATEKFLDQVSMRYGERNTWTSYKSILSQLIDYTHKLKLKLITELNSSLCSDFILEFKNCKATTISKKLNVCRLFMKWTINNWKLKIENPFYSIQHPKKIKTEKNFWNTEQINAILNNTERPEMRFLFSFMCYEGFRFFEAHKVSWNDIGADFINVWGKGDKFAKVPISNKLRSEINLFLDGKEVPTSGRIFSEKITNTEANRAVKKACIKAGIKFDGIANCHRFRHSFASNLIGAGATIVSVQRLMRHASASITLSVYSHIMKEDLNRDVNLI